MKVNELLNFLDKSDSGRFCFKTENEILSEVYSANEACKLYGDNDVVSFKPWCSFFDKEYTGLVIKIADMK